MSPKIIWSGKNWGVTISQHLLTNTLNDTLIITNCQSQIIKLTFCYLSRESLKAIGVLLLHLPISEQKLSGSRSIFYVRAANHTSRSRIGVALPCTSWNNNSQLYESLQKFILEFE